MLVYPDGGQVGTLGGGCVEAEVKQKAIGLLGQDGRRARTRFVLDHDYAWADGLICGGKMVILAESLRGPRAAGLLPGLSRAARSRPGFTEAVVLDPASGRLRRSATGSCSTPRGRLRRALGRRAARRTRRRRRAAGRSAQAVGREGGVAYLPTLPRIRLVDRRRRSRRPGGRRAGGPGRLRRLGRRRSPPVRQPRAVPDRPDGSSSGRSRRSCPALEITTKTYALIVTRGHGHDQEALFHLAPTAASYVGLIGSRRKIKMIFEGPAASRASPSRPWPGSRRRSAWTSARRRSSRSP